MHITSNEELSPSRLVAIEQGLHAIGNPAVEVVVTPEFDDVVNAMLGFDSYRSDRGTGVVGAKTFETDDGAVIVLNAQAIADMSDTNVERLLAHEGGHVLIDSRAEAITGRQCLFDQEWRWQLGAVGGLAMEEFRIERTVGGLGYPWPESSSPHHLTSVLHATNVDLLMLISDEKSADPIYLMNGVIQVLDRLTKVLAYVAAEVMQTSQEVELSQLSALAAANWAELVAPTWGKRLELYSALPSATETLPEFAWEEALLASAALEQEQLLSLGFFFKDEGDVYGFYRTQDESMWTARCERAIQQETIYDE